MFGWVRSRVTFRSRIGPTRLATESLEVASALSAMACGRSAGLAVSRPLRKSSGVGPDTAEATSARMVKGASSAAARANELRMFMVNSG